MHVFAPGACTPSLDSYSSLCQTVPLIRTALSTVTERGTYSPTPLRPYLVLPLRSLSPRSTAFTFTLLNVSTMPSPNPTTKTSLPQVRLASGRPEPEGLTLHESSETPQSDIGDSACVDRAGYSLLLVNDQAAGVPGPSQPAKR
jgi:hypothetical protein